MRLRLRPLAIFTLLLALCLLTACSCAPSRNAGNPVSQNAGASTQTEASKSEPPPVQASPPEQEPPSASPAEEPVTEAKPAPNRSPAGDVSGSEPRRKRAKKMAPPSSSEELGAYPRPGSAAPPPPPEQGSGLTGLAGPDQNYAVMRVFYATDRQATGDPAPGKYYGGERQPDESLHYGTLDVSIPREHRMGRMERPTILKLEIRQDPNKHLVLLSVLPRTEQEFYAALKDKVQSSANKDAFVFIHGFDNTFEQAAWRTAQLAYDLGFQGAPIMYSWPSKGKLTNYSADEATVDWATPHLEAFLETLAARSQATTVHLIAHSMGNRALVRALATIAAKNAGVPPAFKHVFLAAPDIDAGVFRQIAATFPSAASDVTLYASSRDEAIVASEKIHQFDRAGDSRHICVVAKVDTIDATAVDTGFIGHAYFADNRSILSDIFAVIQTGSPPTRRFGMHPAAMGNMTYWVFSP